MNLDLQRWSSSWSGYRPLLGEAFALHRPECLRSPAGLPLSADIPLGERELSSHKGRTVHVYWATLTELLNLWGPSGLTS